MIGHELCGCIKSIHALSSDKHIRRNMRSILASALVLRCTFWLSLAVLEWNFEDEHHVGGENQREVPKTEQENSYILARQVGTDSAHPTRRGRQGIPAFQLLCTLQFSKRAKATVAPWTVAFCSEARSKPGTRTEHVLRLALRKNGTLRCLAACVCWAPLKSTFQKNGSLHHLEIAEPCILCFCSLLIGSVLFVSLSFLFALEWASGQIRALLWPTSGALKIALSRETAF